MYPRLYMLGFKIYSWNACLFLSFIITISAAIILRPKEFPLKRIQIFGVAVLFFIFGFLGAKLLHIMIYASRYRGLGVITVLGRSGTAFLGAPLLGFFVIWIFCKNTSTPFLVLADYAAPLLMLSRVIERFGCLMEGCCYGISSNLPWAYAFRGKIPQHPTQGYALISVLAIFVSSRYLYKNLKNFHGITFFYVILSYSILRFFTEFLRQEGPFAYAWLKVSHIALFIFAAIATAGMYIIIKKSPAKDAIIKILNAALKRLILWLAFSGAVMLLILSFIPKR